MSKRKPVVTIGYQTQSYLTAHMVKDQIKAKTTMISLSKIWKTVEIIVATYFSICVQQMTEGTEQN